MNIEEACPNWLPVFSCDKLPEISLTLPGQLMSNPKPKEVLTTYAPFANTRQPPARPPPQHAHPIPKVHAIRLSSCAAVHDSRKPRTRYIAPVHRDAILPNTLRGGGPIWRCSMSKGTALRSARDARTASSCDVNIESRISEKAMKKKKASQFPRVQRYVRWCASVSVPSPWLIDPKATMPMTPRITTMVP